MADEHKPVFGIDLGTTNSCIAYIDEYGQPVVIANQEGEHTTPSVVQFEGKNRIVGKEAKEGAVLNPIMVVEMVKRQMGDPHWRFEYEANEYTAEEISSYILRKLASDAEEQTGFSVTDVVITCPAYFGIAQREATARAGEIAGLNVWEVINEPTAGAITYGLQTQQEKVVLVYDLGGGTFDITVIELKNGAITVVATGGNHYLGGRNWDEVIVIYLAQEWMNKTGSSNDPLEAPETLQYLWKRAETAKCMLTVKRETTAMVAHAGKEVEVTLTRDTFNELTAHLLEQTIAFTTSTMLDAGQRGVNHFDQILLVGGSTRMPQVAERLKAELRLPITMFDPDEAVAKGAAIYGHKLKLDKQTQIKLTEIAGTATESIDVSAISPTMLINAQEAVASDEGLKSDHVKKFNDLLITNVASHSFGILAQRKDPGTGMYRDFISNLVLVNDPLPRSRKRTYGTLDAQLGGVALKIMENLVQAQEVDDPGMGEEICSAILVLPPGLSRGTQIEVIFELNRQGRLHILGREPSTNTFIELVVETAGGISEEEIDVAKERASKVVIL